MPPCSSVAPRRERRAATHHNNALGDIAASISMIRAATRCTTACQLHGHRLTASTGYASEQATRKPDSSQASSSLMHFTFVRQKEQAVAGPRLSVSLTVSLL
jgi:hypothetical protein